MEQNVLVVQHTSDSLIFEWRLGGVFTGIPLPRRCVGGQRIIGVVFAIIGAVVFLCLQSKL